MSSEWNEPGAGATWQNAGSLDWDDSYEEIPSLSFEENEIEEDDIEQGDIPATHSPPPSAEEEPALDELVEPFATKFEAFQEFGRHLLPVLIPLLLGGLTFLFVLPFALRNQAYVHADYLWIIGLIIVALAILQGTILAYTDINDVFWLLAIAVGFCLFALVGFFAIFGPLVAAIVFVLLAIVGIVAIRSYIHPVPEGTVDVVYAFGKYSRTLYPGANFLLPWERVESHLPAREIIWTSPEQVVQVSHNQDVHLKAMLSYQLVPEDAHLVVVELPAGKWEEHIHDLFCTLLQAAAGKLSADDFLLWPQPARSNQRSEANFGHLDEESPHREFLNNLLFQQMRDKVALWGVQINWVQIRDVILTPHASPTVQREPVAPEVAGNAGNTTGTATASMPSFQSGFSSMNAGIDNDITEKMDFVPPAASPAGMPPQGNEPPVPTKLPSEEVLIQAYKQVQEGKIRSPEAIRSIAAKFQAVAADSEASQKVSFDAALAARALYERAALYERHGHGRGSSDETPPISMPGERTPRPPKEENLTSGG